MNAIWAKALEDGIEITGRQILEKVLRSKFGYVRGLSYGVKPNKSRELELEALLETEKIESEKRNGELIEQIQSQQAKIDNLEDSYDQLKFLIDELRRERGGSENASVSLHEVEGLDNDVWWSQVVDRVRVRSVSRLIWGCGRWRPVIVFEAKRDCWARVRGGKEFGTDGV
ncbi:hypothetical protein DITRI_Ditri02bG0114600 [Diplodiscus trichospermus]